MKLTFETRGSEAAVARLDGRLDATCCDEVKAQLLKAVAEGDCLLIVDLGEVPFIDSSGLGTLVGCLKAARLAGGDLRLASPGDQARKVLAVTLLDRVLRPYADVEEALAG